MPAVPTGDSAGSGAQPPDRLAETSVPIHPPIAERWSPRAFDSDAALSEDDLIAVLEAARWAPTWGDRQPVRFIVGVRGDETFDTIAELLKRGNSYARAANALILVCADEGDDDRTKLYSAVDAGAATTNLIIEAVSRGLIAHPMAGFDAVGAAETFRVSERMRPLVVIAVGKLGDYADVTPEIAERDGRRRHRLPLTDVVLNWRQRP